MVIYTAHWVLPISRPSFENGAVAVDGGRIAWVGPAVDAPPGERRDLGDCALMPGLVNTHSHLELTAMRGWLEDLPFRTWIIRLTKARQEVLTRERLFASARLGIAEGLLAGVTTYADTCASGVVHEALREMQVRGIMYLEAFGPDPAQAEASLNRLLTEVQSIRERDTGFVKTGVSPHAPYSVSDSLFVAITTLAGQQHLPMAIHVAESEAEQQLITEARGDFADAWQARGIRVSARGASTVELLDRLGVLRAQPLLIHAVRATPDDIQRIARHGCAIAHCPASNAKLGHGIADLAGFLDAGIPVGLGSDSVSSNNRMDILDEARLAILMGRARGRRWDAFPAALGLGLATRGGATSLGMEREIGTLDVGKAADLAAFPLGGLHTRPMQDPESALVFATSGRGASLVTVAGTELVRDGRLQVDITRDIEVVQDAAVDLKRLSCVPSEDSPKLGRASP